MNLDLFKKYEPNLCNIGALIYHRDNIKTNILQAAMNAYASDIKTEKFIGLIDTTFFGTGKKGYLFTTTAMYCSDLKNKPLYYRDIENIEVIVNDLKNDNNNFMKIYYKQQVINNRDYFIHKHALKQLLEEACSMTKNKATNNNKTYLFLCQLKQEDMLYYNKKEKIYTQALNLFQAEQYDKALLFFIKIANYKASSDLIKICENRRK